MQEELQERRQLFPSKPVQGLGGRCPWRGCLGSPVNLEFLPVPSAAAMAAIRKARLVRTARSTCGERAQTLGFLSAPRGLVGWILILVVAVTFSVMHVGSTEVAMEARASQSEAKRAKLESEIAGSPLREFFLSESVAKVPLEVVGPRLALRVSVGGQKLRLALDSCREGLRLFASRSPACASGRPAKKGTPPEAFECYDPSLSAGSSSWCLNWKETCSSFSENPFVCKVSRTHDFKYAAE